MENSIAGAFMNNFQSSMDMDEFEDFEKRVEEVNAIVQNMILGGNVNQHNAIRDVGEASNEAVEKAQIKRPVIEPGNVKKRINKTIINKTVSENESSKEEPSLSNLNTETMSQDAFMKIVEADANKRSKDRMERNKRADISLREGNDAFRKGNLEKALYFYNQAIDVRKDSYLLYTNRALTLLKLGLFTRASGDCDSALKIRETLKPRLYKGRALFEMGEEEQSVHWMEETRKLYPTALCTIVEYEAQWQKSK